MKHNQDGAANGLLISFIFVLLLLIGAAVFGGWAYMSRQDYKENVDSKIAEAVEIAKGEESKKKDAEFVEAEKKPYRTYVGPAAQGSVTVVYPKTWSVYADETSSNNEGLDGYFHPKVVPGVTEASTYALRIQISEQTYSDALTSYSDQGDQAPKIKAYALPKVPKVVGAKIVGNLDGEKKGTLILLPLRAQTLKIWTDGDQYLKDFNNVILPNLSFSP